MKRIYLQQALKRRKMHSHCSLSPRPKTCYTENVNSELCDLNNKLQNARDRRSMNIFTSYLSALANNLKIESTHSRRKIIELTESLASKESVEKFLEKCNKNHLNCNEDKIKKTIDKCIRIQMKQKSLKIDAKSEQNSDLDVSS